MSIYSDGNAAMAIKTALDLLTFRGHFFEREWPHPSTLSAQICALIKSFGLQQVLQGFEACVKEVTIPEKAQELFSEFLHYAKESKVQGYDL